MMKTSAKVFFICFVTVAGLICIYYFIPCCQDDGTLSFTVLQMNDVYEISPHRRSNLGGLARVATLRKELIAKDPNTLTVIAGDFLSPTYFGTLKDYDSAAKMMVPIFGKQMVDILNRIGVDYATFGNHEFDGDTGSLQRRIDESSFQWISANVLDSSDRGKFPFFKQVNSTNVPIPPYVIRDIDFGPKGKLKVGIIGVTGPYNKAKCVAYKDIIEAAELSYHAIRDKCDVVIALTHANVCSDIDLASRIPGLHLITGGHEHSHIEKMVGTVPITKADANATTVFVHKIVFYRESKKVKVTSQLVPVNGEIPEDSSVKKSVQSWKAKEHQLIVDNKFKPDSVLMHTNEPLNALEDLTRTSSTNYTRLLGEALLYAVPDTDAILYNSGSIRIDDMLTGDITVYDVLCSLPYRGSFVVVECNGADLKKIMTIGRETNKGGGGYLQWTNATFVNGTGTVRCQPIDDHDTYRILMPKYVAEGWEQNLGFIADMKYTFPEKLTDGIRNDFVAIVIHHMANLNKRAPHHESQ